MSKKIPPLADLGGLKEIRYSVMQDEHGRSILISNEIVKAYLSYLATCRAKQLDELSFGEWMTTDVNSTQRMVA